MPDAASALANDQDSLTLSQLERVVDTFIEPSKTFNDIKRNRSWWLPFLILAVLGYVFSFVAVQHVGWDSLVVNVLKSNPRNAEKLDKGTPVEQAQMISATKGFMEGFMVGSPVVVLAVNALFALVLWGCFSFVLGGATTYGEMFAVSIYASLRGAWYADRDRNFARQRSAGLQHQRAVAGHPGLFPRSRSGRMAQVNRHIAGYLLPLVVGAVGLRWSDRGQGKTPAASSSFLVSGYYMCS
jgi:Yip1 domain